MLASKIITKNREYLKTVILTSELSVNYVHGIFRNSLFILFFVWNLNIQHVLACINHGGPDPIDPPAIAPLPPVVEEPAVVEIRTRDRLIRYSVRCRWVLFFPWKMFARAVRPILHATPRVPEICRVVSGEKSGK